MAHDAGNERINVLLVGAGLSNGLLAWQLRQSHPHLKVVILEASSCIDKSRTWSFHATDVDNLEDISPLIGASWIGHDVYFPRRQRVFNSGYHSIEPAHFESQMKTLLGSDLRFNSRVVVAAPDYVVLEDGARLAADCVIDGRGMPALSNVGYQKFVGLRVQLEQPHGLGRPILMDARIEQRDGFRFMYVLPWGPTELLIEDTRYSGTAEIDSSEYVTEIRKYARTRDWRIAEEISFEKGALAIPMTPPQFVYSPEVAPRIGTAHGFFHPVTGYSLPDGVRIARRIARLSTLTSASVRAELDQYAAERSNRVRFYCLLNRMMLKAAAPQERYRVFEHFYRLPEETIQRFYAGESKAFDALRILSGKPPVPVWSALQSALSRHEASL